ncbi:hypothetical protein [Trueperella sp. LYQ143]|uniref:hypothetical protein n=1 Tax=unclassified Trueperella TaxID=2630174 RepID=UPI003983398B
MHLTTGVFWTGTHRAQIGIDPRIAVDLTGLSPAELDLVDSLSRPQTDVELRARADARHIPRERLTQLLEALTRAGVLDTTERYSCDPHAWRRIFGVYPQHREHSHVHIPHLDYLGAGIALGLVRNGIGIVTTSDHNAVSTRDHPLMRHIGLGTARSTTLRTLLRQENPHICLATTHEPQLVVLTGSYTTDPVRAGRYLAAGKMVYHAWVDEIDVYAGPLSIAHETACGTCLALHRYESDERWGILCQQACAAAPLLPDPAAAMLATALAVRDILSALDGHRVEYSWRVPPPPDPPEAHIVTTHPRCGCHNILGPAEVTTPDNRQ